ncbi:DNA endonuclease RBBP8 [Collichthys lucidus]|uniref:DNA endonuclease RBBP8 n=1 Tax=Collichthys lucidus TaxID=240159 RepID=A0A4U5VHX8_COLLU|nr:DNA endonuclease RBBP8 [Collichthys lucidus]
MHCKVTHDVMMCCMDTLRDAQRLEVFYSRNQQLKEQNKSLQDTISLLEERPTAVLAVHRLREGECDRCATLGENLKSTQDQNLRLITKLKNERNSLEDENRKLHAEIQELKLSRSELQQASSPEQEDSFIPDSPVLPSSLPVANRLKKHRNADKMKRVRYVEMPLRRCNNSLFNDDVNLNLEEAIAETCALELFEKPHMKTETTVVQQSSSKPPRKYDVHIMPHRSSVSSTLIHSPDSTTERSPSLLPRVKRFSEDASVNKAKRKKENEPEVQEEDKQVNQEGVDRQKEGKQIEPELIKRSAAPLSNQSFMKEPLDIKVQSAQNRTSSQRLNVSCASPAFKKPNIREIASKDVGAKREKPLQDLNASHDRHDAERKHKVEPTWSVDPALALSMYDSEWRGGEQTEEQQCHGGLEDTDCTWVSHSMLQGRDENNQNRRDSVSGLGEKANDSLDMMFDTTACGEYKSYNGSQSQPCHDDEGDGEEEEEDHGYIKEENTPLARPRRRQPFNVLFSPKRKQQEN